MQEVVKIGGGSVPNSLPIRIEKPQTSNVLIHGGLHRWRENSLPFFLYQKLKEILTRFSRTILTALKKLVDFQNLKVVAQKLSSPHPFKI